MKLKITLRNPIFKNYLKRVMLIVALMMSLSSLATTFTVTNGNDSGLGSLRQAILDANTNPGADVIEFSGSLTISLISDLPQINSGGLTIDGTTVLGYIGTPLISIQSVTTRNYVFFVNGATSITIKGVDIATGLTGIRVLSNVTSCTITDNLIMSRNTGVWTEATNATVTGNDFTNSGFGANKYALRVRSSGNMLVRSNTWGGGEGGFLVEGSDLTVHNTYNPSLTRQVVLENNSGIHNYSRLSLGVGNGGYSNIVIDGLKLSKTADRTGAGITLIGIGTGTINITNCDIQGRTTALLIDGLNNGNIVDYTISGNNFTNSGGSGVFINPGVEIRQNAFTAGHIAMHSNTWGGSLSNFGMRINGSSNLVIGDENVTNADIVIEDNSGFNSYSAVGGFNAGYNLVLQNSNNTTIDGLDVSRTSALGVGLSIVGGSNNTITNLLSNRGAIGLEYLNSPNGNVSNSSFSNMNTGIFLSGASTLNINNSNFGCITIFAVDNNTNPVTNIVAKNNFWEDASGPSNLGGTGETYDGTVDALNFLTAPSTTAPDASLFCPALQLSVADTTPPTVLTKPITVNLDANGNATITPQQIDNGSTDDSGSITLSLDVTTFSCENVGANTVTLTGVDSSGNTTSATAVVTVEDNISPTAITQAFTTTIADGVTTITPTDVDGGSYDNCGIQSMSISPNTFVCGDQGNHIVVLTLTDNSGNTATTIATVTVLGDVPTIAIADFTAVPTQNTNTVYLGYGLQSMALSTTTLGGTGFTYSWTASTDEIVASVANPTVSPLVSTTYTVTVTNANGCDATTSISVCVIDARAIDKDGEYEGEVLVCKGGESDDDYGDDDYGDDDYHAPKTKEVEQEDVREYLEEGGILGGCNATCSTTYVEVDNDDYNDDDYVDNDNKNQSDDSHKTKVIIYPNPAEFDFNIDITNLEFVNTRINIYSMDMILMKVIQISEANRNNILNVVTDGMLTGVYFVVVTTDENTYIKRVVIK